MAIARWWVARGRYVYTDVEGNVPSRFPDVAALRESITDADIEAARSVPQTAERCDLCNGDGGYQPSEPWSDWQNCPKCIKPLVDLDAARKEGGRE